MPNPVITTSGLILKEMDYRENDTLITILTKDLGVVFARARGAKRSRSHIAAPTGLFAYSNLTLYRSKDKFTLDSAGFSVFMHRKGMGTCNMYVPAL